jgi:hypothetical protein
MTKLFFRSAIAALLLVLFSCKREEVNFLGPAYISAPEGFAVTSFAATPSSVDFSSSFVEFNATFTHTVSWILTIKGQKSGALHEIRGMSNGLDNVPWRGTHDELAFFRRGETVTATLSFFGTSLTAATDIYISVAPDFSACGTFPKDGDFEDAPKITFPNWARFNVAEQGVDSMAVDFNGNIVPSIQGNNYYYIRGLGSQPVFVDGIQYIGLLSPALPADPDNVWANIYLYGTGDPNTLVNFELQEEDFDGTSPGYTGTDDDGFVATINAGHVGWKLFSFKYSSLLPSGAKDFGGSGNKIHEPHNLKFLVVVLLKANNPDKPVEIYFDYPIITVGGPFKPCK